MKQEKRSVILLLVVAGCALYTISGGIRSSFGVVVQALADRTGVSYAAVSFAVAVGLLFFSGTGALCFGIIMGTLYAVRAVMVAVFLLLLPKTAASVFVFIEQSGNYTAIWAIDVALCALAALAGYRIQKKVRRIA